MKVLVIGNGAREHAIAWKLAQSPEVPELLVAPGNAGTAQLARNVPIAAIDIDGLLGLARDEHIDFTVVGPDAPLVAGIVDRFEETGVPVFGPTREAARIEGSKSFAKDLMVRHDVPTGAAQTFDSYDEAAAYVRSIPAPIVVKADGLTAGKGVVICGTHEEALVALHQQMVEGQFGHAGKRVLIEEYLEGLEISVFAFVHGGIVSPMVAACDFKRAGDGDTGPNTGGMGSFSPPLIWTGELEHQIRTKIVEPVVRALSERGSPYKGVLYGGLILTADGPKVIEFNCRLGDPEAQVVLPRLKTDLLDVMMRTAQGRLEGAPIEWDASSCVGVVVASGGYPGDYETGHPIEGLDGLDVDVNVFHAGTRLDPGGDSKVLTDGGRVLTIAASGETLGEARHRAYENVARIRFKDAFYRGDIAQ